jgi:hypothetical protein
VWNVVGVALNLDAMPSSFSELYRQCYASFSGIDRKVVMIGVVALCWTLWRTRNNSFFDGMRPNDPTNVIFLICHFLNSWAKLQRSTLRKLLQLGASRLAAVAHEVFGRHHVWNPVIRKLAM